MIYVYINQFLGLFISETNLERLSKFTQSLLQIKISIKENPYLGIVISKVAVIWKVVDPNSLDIIGTLIL